jgi:hypothetical protein
MNSLVSLAIIQGSKFIVHIVKKTPVMKYNLLLIILLALPVASFCQNRALNKFYRQHKREAGVQNMKLPGWLIRLGGKIAKKHVDAKEEKLAMDLLKDFGNVRFMYQEEGKGIPRKDMQDLRNDLIERHHFDDLIMIREGKMDFELMIHESGGVINSLVMIYNDREEGEMVFISAKANISLEAIRELIKAGMEKEIKEFFEEPQPEEVIEPTL